jgi:hypothetical protein
VTQISLDFEFDGHGKRTSSRTPVTVYAAASVPGTPRHHRRTREDAAAVSANQIAKQQPDKLNCSVIGRH